MITVLLYIIVELYDKSFIIVELYSQVNIYPWMMFLENRGKDGKGHHRCGATLITSRYLIIDDGQCVHTILQIPPYCCPLHV